MQTLTADCTIEQTSSKADRVNVDSGTQAGSQVPVGVFCNILNMQYQFQTGPRIRRMVFQTAPRGEPLLLREMGVGDKEATPWLPYRLSPP
jgi:hypothetical protein